MYLMRLNRFMAPSLNVRQLPFGVELQILAYREHGEPQVLLNVSKQASLVLRCAD